MSDVLPTEDLAMIRKSMLKFTGLKLPESQQQALSNLTSIAPTGAPNTWAVTQLAEMEPKDPRESMLCQQMIAIHRMAMECSRRALLEGQTVYVVEMSMKHASKLMNSFAILSAALDKHRGKGQQKITVEHQHVQVESGGQAIIGDVHHGGGANEKSE